jgi:hypothetical protein
MFRIVAESIGVFSSTRGPAGIDLKQGSENETEFCNWCGFVHFRSIPTGLFFRALVVTKSSSKSECSLELLYLIFEKCSLMFVTELTVPYLAMCASAITLSSMPGRRAIGE